MSVLRDGRFGNPAGDDLQRFASSLAVDLQMLDEDIEGSIAHATMLGECGIVAPREALGIVRGLEAVRDEIRSGDWTPCDADEDLHMAVERRLTERLGDVAKKLHTARSRNDQVATHVRLWLRTRLRALDTDLAALIATLVRRAESDGRVLLPGYTHLQRGQPVLLGHHLLAHAWALTRDRERVAGALTRCDRSPLGACAMAGTPHPIDRVRVAELLDFSGLVENAMDAVSARDHEIEAVAACAIVMTHLSRVAEELVLWSSAEFDFVRLDDAYATGSSVMPQKRNPDAAELVRGKTARVCGALQALLMLVKGLPLAYNRDLQEDRAALFDAVETTRACIAILDGVWRTLTVRSDRFENDLRGDASLATEIADHLAARGVPFRDAHDVAARIARWCDEHGSSLAALTPEQAAAFHPELAGADPELWRDPRAAAERRTSRGGTASVEIDRQIAILGVKS